MTFFILVALAFLGWVALVTIGLFAIVGFQDGVFWTIAAASVATALGVVLIQDVFKAALSLVATFLLIAGLFVLMSAEFLAAVQVLIYAGAISILIIFAALLTRDAVRGSPSNKLQVPMLITTVIGLAAIIFVVINTDWEVMDAVLSLETMNRVEGVLTTTPSAIAGLLLTEWVLPFEAVSVLLLAAILGALALLKEHRDDA